MIYLVKLVSHTLSNTIIIYYTYHTLSNTIIMIYYTCQTLSNTIIMIYYTCQTLSNTIMIYYTCQTLSNTIIMIYYTCHTLSNTIMIYYTCHTLSSNIYNDILYLPYIIKYRISPCISRRIYPRTKYYTDNSSYTTVRNTLREIELQNDYCNGCGLTNHGCGMTLLSNELQIRIIGSIPGITGHN